MQKILAFVMSLLCLQSVTAQTIVKGKVIDNNKVPVAAATVLILAKNDSSLVKGQATNAEGIYELTNITAGNYILMVEMVGHHTIYQNLNVLPNQKINEQGTLTLIAGEVSLNEVVVTGKKRLFETQVDRTVFNVQNSPAAASLTVLEVLARSPNIVIDRVNNQISMNGKQGVIVMLNGKPMRMEQSVLMQYLGGLTAANIKKIEFIHTPPASMDAAGNAGVINIETIKKEDEGLNGNLVLNAGYGQRGKYGGAFNLNYNKGRLNFFSDFSFSVDYAEQDVTNKITSVAGGVTTNINLFSKRPAFNGLQNGRMGFNYQLTKKTSIGMLLSGYISHWKLDAQTETVTGNDTGYYSLSKLRSVETNIWKHVMGNINFQHNFSDKEKLTADFDYLHYTDNDPAEYEDANYNKNGNLDFTSVFNSRKKTPIDFIVMNIDYLKTISDKLKIELGLKNTASTFTNDVGVDRLVNNIFKPDPIFTDILHLNENIAAAYVSADYQFNPKSFFRAGLRYEKTNSDLDGKENKKILALHYGRLFPTVSFSYRFKDNERLQVSYNERITRPPFGAIAPAFFFFGPNSILGGNPAVRPTISRQLTSSFQLKNLLFSIELSKEENSLVFQPSVDTVKNFVLLRAENMKTSKTAMFAVNYNAKIKWWSSQYNIAFFVQQLQPVVNGTVLTRNDSYFTINITQSFKLPAGFTVEVTDQTRTPRNYGLAKSPVSTSLNLGGQKKLSGNDKISFSMTDIFNTGSFIHNRYEQPQLNVQYELLGQFEAPVFKLSFIHQFGRDKIKKADSRKTASEEELNRVN